MQRGEDTMRFAIATVIMVAATAHAQQCAPHAGRVSGEVRDVTGALIVGASVSIDAGLPLYSDKLGRFESACVNDGQHTVSIQADGFEAVAEHVRVGSEMRPMIAKLKPSAVTTSVDAVDATGVDNQDFAGTKTLHADDLKQMADDPDEFARQLQVLAAAAGGAPGQSIITVDGFQNGSRLPPKSAIAFIRVNPDLFAAEYERPPYQGGRIEIYTKPGTAKVHGSLVTTQSAAFMNAKDAFATSRAAIGRQRYAAELSGPIKKNKSDFALNIEHRQINQFAVVNAVSLDDKGNNVTVNANVPTPQSLWSASARIGWMPNAKNNITATYTVGANSFMNLGIGGTTLAESGYNSQQAEHVIRLTDMQTLSARLVHESRVGFTWRNRDDTPLSNTPSLQVQGAFTAGGILSGAASTHERDLEIDDDVLYTRGKHSAKAGIELLDANFDNRTPTQFNGLYIFGGGEAPSPTGTGTVTISGLEQYRRSLLGLPGGSPTEYTVVTGNPALSLNQLRVVLYAQDQWKLNSRLSMTFGLRYAVQSTPTALGAVAPRLGLAWSPDHAQKWVFHARTGLFFTPIDTGMVLEANRLNGVRQTQVKVYNPDYNHPLANPSQNITTIRTPLPPMSQTPSFQSNLGVEHELPWHLHAQANLYLVRGWNLARSRNINSPLNDSPYGPRPGPANLNLYQFQQSGVVHGNVMFASLDQHSLRHVQVFAGYIRMDLRTNAEASTFFPQSSTSDVGETARPAWQTTHHVILFSNITLPKEISLSTQFDAASGVDYTVTTGFDNNGDGQFNDRPRYATGSESAIYHTRFGALTPNGTGPSIARGVGTLPWNFHLDENLSRTFVLPHRDGAGQSIAVNLRSTNLLNHTNVTAVGTVLGSPLFGQAFASDAGRRVEAGLRYSF
jgi:hypothetical protein